MWVVLPSARTCWAAVVRACWWRHLAPVRAVGQPGRREQQLEVDQVVDDDGDLPGGAVPAADRTDLRHPPGRERGRGAHGHGGVGAVAGECCAAAEAGLEQEAEVVGRRVVLAHRQRRLPLGGPAGPDRPAARLVREPEAAGVEPGQPAVGPAGAPAGARRNGREAPVGQPVLGARELLEREQPGRPQLDLGALLAGRRPGRTQARGGRRQHHRQRGRQRCRRGDGCRHGPSARSPGIRHRVRRYVPRPRQPPLDADTPPVRRVRCTGVHNVKITDGTASDGTFEAD